MTLILKTLDIKRSDHFLSPSAPLALLKRHPQENYGLHIHDTSELVIIYEGEGVHYTPGGSYKVTKGDVFVVTGKQEHGYKEMKGCCLMNILFEEDRIFHLHDDIKEIPGYFALTRVEPTSRESDKFETRLHLDAMELGYAMQLLHQIENEIEHEKIGWISASSAILKELLVFLARTYTSKGEQGGFELMKISGILAYIDSHYTEDINLEQILETFELSGSTLLRLFKKAVGRPPGDYILHMRLRHAGTLLKTSALTVGEVALRCGFNDSNYFTRMFKKVMGVTPLVWRRG